MIIYHWIRVSSLSLFTTGRWVFLQNCHLAASWMPRLKMVVSNFNKPQSDVDPLFRLFLSSKPDKDFPVSILQTGIKVN